MQSPYKLLVLAIALLSATAYADPPRGKYATVNGVNMYYEVHGQGKPLVLIHGAFCTIEGCFGQLLPQLAKTRQVIVVELQGHGRTADIDRPLQTPLLADDIHALMGKLKIPSADIYGYSMGGGVAFQLALRHPERVKKLVIAGAALTKEGVQPGTIEMIKKLDPAMMEASPFAEAYKKTSPHPEKFRTLVTKISKLDTLDGYKLSDVKKLKMPVLFLIGDSDFATVEHGAEVFRALGGGGFGDAPGGNPRSKNQLAILPGTSHVDLIFRGEMIATLVNPFLDAK